MNDVGVKATFLSTILVLLVDAVYYGAANVFSNDNRRDKTSEAVRSLLSGIVCENIE